ncbi:uncharacterized protein JCM15063_005677 [Sporobolomyces koalae]|uniref:uncharacterized protein n=1 Tax=Sporobolomyces koalae TaxID=500713 RepID=UPI00317523DC
MNIDLLIDQVLPLPHPANTSIRSPAEYGTRRTPSPPRTRHALQSQSQPRRFPLDRDASAIKTTDPRIPSRSDVPRNMSSCDETTADSRAPVSKLRSFFRSSSTSSSPKSHKPAESTITSFNNDVSSTRSRTRTREQSNNTRTPSTSVLASPFSRKASSSPIPTQHTRTHSTCGSSFSISSVDIGQSPARRPSSSPSCSSSTTGKKERSKHGSRNLSIWSISSAVLPLNTSSSTRTKQPGDDVRSTDSSSFQSRHRRDHSSVSSLSRPGSSLSIYNPIVPASPPNRSVQSLNELPSTPQQHRNHSDSTSSHAQSVSRDRLTPPGATRPSMKKPSISDFALKTLTTLRVRNPTDPSDGHRTRTSSRGEVTEELTEEELDSWKLKNRKPVPKSNSFEFHYGGASVDSRDQISEFGTKRTRTSSSKSYLEHRGIGLGMGRDAFSTLDRDQQDDSDSDDEILIIDETKSKGFSSLLGEKYDDFLMHPPAAIHLAPQTPPTLPVDNLQVTPTMSDLKIPTMNTPSTLGPPPVSSPRNPKRLSQGSTNSEIALWLDASNVSSFPSSPLPPPPPTTMPSPCAPDLGDKPFKLSAFSSSLVHPSPTLSTSSPKIGPEIKHRESLIPLSPSCGT